MCYLAGPRRESAEAEAARPLGGSSNGRTTDSDSVYRGSNPRPPANLFSKQNLILEPARLAGFRVLVCCNTLREKTADFLAFPGTTFYSMQHACNTMFRLSSRPLRTSNPRYLERDNGVTCTWRSNRGRPLLRRSIARQIWMQILRWRMTHLSAPRMLFSTSPQRKAADWTFGKANLAGAISALAIGWLHLAYTDLELALSDPLTVAANAVSKQHAAELDRIDEEQLRRALAHLAGVRPWERPWNRS
jgi:hypothetical protein